jgi:PAS domain S-box-containing protein
MAAAHFVHGAREALREDGEFVLFRRRSRGGAPKATVLLLAPVSARPSRDSIQKLEHELSLKVDLDPEWAAVPLALVEHEDRPALLLDDAGGQPLDRLIHGPMELGRFLHFAAGIARALRELHARNLIHKNLKPANVLVDAETSKVRLMGFGIASRLRRVRQSPEPPELIAGTLPYMAPEQTGRMNRSVDSRSDLYALGVTLYEMLTGSLPFNAADPMEWVHCHIAREAVPPHERCADVPPAVSAIVMKLLAKTPEERYQTAGGVERDLRRCLASWEARAPIDAFPLGEHDTPDRLVIPERLYGRSREVAALLAAFERMVSSGTAQLVLISGHSGIGKSAAVNELHRALVPSRALFAAGKFDQYKRDIPYSTLAQAFQGLIRHLLAKSDAELAPWRDALRQALGPNARLMLELVPELNLIIGEQPPVPELARRDAQRRFHLAFRRLIGVFARPEHPLALFLDDLQWLDAATLDLLEQVLIEGDAGHLLLIGAYRDNEVDAGHPLARRLDAIRAAGARVQEIHLAPLAREDVTQLIADALCCEAVDAAPLAQLMHDKTAGNPFFVIQFLRLLAEEGLLAFDHEQARWSWDLDRIHAKQYTENVADLMVGKLNRLPIETTSVLRLLACLGSAADTSRLSLVCGTAEAEIHAHLWEAVRQELLERRELSYVFPHDRIREAAYTLIPQAERAETHLRIGRLLAAHTPAEKQEEAIFEIVNHLDRCTALIISEDEREQLAQFNLMAGKRAKSSTAYAMALNYFVTGGALLSDASWDRRHQLAFSLELNRAECEFLTGMLPAAEARLAALSTRAANAIEQASVACLRVDLYTTLGQSDRAVAVGLDCLRQMGIHWLEHPTDEDVRREYEELRCLLGSRSIEDLLDLSLMSEPPALATLDVLTALLPPAFFTDANLRALVILKAVNLSVEWGNSDASCTPYVMLGMIAGARFGDYEAGLRFSNLGKELVEHRGLRRFQARTYLNYANVVMPWTQRFRSGRDLLRRAFETASNSGDVTFAAYSCASLNVNFLAAGDPLAEAQREAENGLRFAENARFGLVVDIIRAQLALIRMLRGSTLRFGVFDDGHIEELGFERHLSASRARAVPESWYWIRKLQARFFAGDYASALAAAEKARRLRWAPPQLFEVAEYEFYCALSRTAAWDRAPPHEREEHLEALRAHHRHLEGWAQNCPENFSDRAALVGAEIARIQGRELDAEHMYQEAIRAARANGLVHNEALAHELAARFYAGRGFEEFAHLYLQKARHGYLGWGADGKVRQLDELYPHLRREEAIPGPVSTIAAPVEHLDLATVLKVSQAVSGEFVLDKLIDKLMRTALEHAGAQRGLLIDSRDGVLRLEAQAVTSGNDMIVHRTRDPIETVGLSRSMVNYVSRTHEVAIFDTAERESPFHDDEYVRDSHVRSILCLPLIRQGRVVALLYLENNLAARVFTPARVAVLTLLASQAATSLENSRLYRELQEREGKFRRLVDSNIIGVVVADLDGAILEANEAFLSMLGYSQDDLAAGRLRWADITPVEWLAANQRAWEQTRAIGRCEAFEKEYFRKDGSRVRVLVGGAAFDDTRTKAISFVLDLTERKRAADEHRAHVWFLESIDRINRAMQGTADLERMMRDVLDVLLDVFACDRAWLIYPCDPHAPSWRTVMERTQPQFPGAFALNADLPTDPDKAAVFASALASSAPVLLLPGKVAQRLAIRSQIAMAVHPKVDQPYLFGLHQCSYERVWTEPEKRLFEEVGARLADALTSLLMFRSLQESERKLESAQRIARVGWWERDFRTNRVSLSDEVRRTFGVEPLDLPHWHERWVNVIHPEDRPKAAAAAAAALNGGPPYDVEYRVVRPDGSMRVVHSQGEVIWDDSGQPVRQFGMLQDITALRQAEHELRASEERFRTFVDHATDAFFLLDEQVIVVDVNRQACAGLGYSREELIGMHPREFDVGLDERSIAQLGARVGAGETVTFETVHQRKDGVVFPVEIRARAFQQGEQQFILSLVRDISERKRAEEELRASEERFRTLVQFSFDVYWETDAQHRFTRQEFIEGLADAPEPGSEIGKTRWEVPYLEPDEEAWRKHRATLDAHLPFRDFEIARPAADGGKRYVSTSGLPVFDETGRFIGYRGVGRHITERKRAEQELQRLHLHLVHMGRVMTTAELATSIAHEVNQPLGSILASVGPCLRWLNAQPPDLASARGALERMANDAERASQVISRIRALVRREPPRHERINVNQVISEVIALTRDQIHSHDVALQSELAADLIVVHGDRVQLQQVILNLIANAIEAMSTIRDRRRQLAILSANDGTGVRVEVRDCGPGVDPDGAERIFEPFYTTKADGIGMGLWICRSIVEAHGGRLWVTPNPPQGAAFQFSLPGRKLEAEWAARQGRQRQRSSRAAGRADQ